MIICNRSRHSKKAYYKKCLFDEEEGHSQYVSTGGEEKVEEMEEKEEDPI